MSEKVVSIYVSRQFRDKIKAKKHELTYEEFFNNLFKIEFDTNYHDFELKDMPIFNVKENSGDKGYFIVSPICTYSKTSADKLAKIVNELLKKEWSKK